MNSPAAAVASTQRLSDKVRPEISVYWQPGCSSCLKLKEFVEELGVEFELINVMDLTNPDLDAHMAELTATGYRSIPVVRKGNRYAFAQSIDDVAELLGVNRNHKRLSDRELFARLDRILSTATAIVQKFPEEELQKWVIPYRERTIKELANHVAQIANTHLRQIEEGLTDIRPSQSYMAPTTITRSDLLSVMEEVRQKVLRWVAAGKVETTPKRIPTSYGEQDFGVVLERAVWHCAQHTRQLDYIAAGRLGAELEVPAGLFDGLPLPRRLWQ